jgi:hypothetical protein
VGRALQGRRIRRRKELQALSDGKVRLFCLTNAQLTFAQQAEWLLANRHRIIQASRKPGTYVYGIYRDRIARPWPR